MRNNWFQNYEIYNSLYYLMKTSIFYDVNIRLCYREQSLFLPLPVSSCKGSLQFFMSNTSANSSLFGALKWHLGIFLNLL